MDKFDLSFGNSVAVRKAFLNTVEKDNVLFTYQNMIEMDYPVHEGDPALVHLTKQIIWRQVGNIYKHVFITNGATGADVIALRAYAQKGHTSCLTRPAPYYGRFPGMIQAAGLHHLSGGGYSWNHIVRSVLLMDLPANPTGSFRDDITFHSGPVILDGVYFNNVYCGKTFRQEYPHDVLTGSYSKLLGINGLRLGWLATNDDLLAERVKALLTAEYCGLSVPSMTMTKLLLKDLNWDNFEYKAKVNLDYNREEFSKLEKFFSNAPVPEVGMFYYAPVDKACEKLLTKSGLIWTKGGSMGTTDDFGRFNTGQDVALVREAVQTVLKNDKS